MISVRNHRPPLSGNKWLLFAAIAVLAAACSPKLRPSAATQPVPVQPPAFQTKPVEKPVVKPAPKVSSIAMLLPFGLSNLNPGMQYSSSALEQANMALDYYQGFKLALDSLTALGYNYKLQLFDTGDKVAQTRALAANAQVKNSDLIIGPVFAEDIKPFLAASLTSHKPELSPLAPSEPSLFKSPNLITAMPPLDCHAWAAAAYINSSIKPKKIFVLRSGYSDENNYLLPFKKAIDSLSKKRIPVSQTTVVHGNLNAIIPQLSAASTNVFVVPATNQAFLMITLKALDSLSEYYPIAVFGHPSWSKFGFLNAELLERIHTYVTSSEKIDYKSDAVMNFMTAYQSTFHTIATDYAIKGFDEGLYFGKLLAMDGTQLTHLDKNNFVGLHNSFQFAYRPGLGWVNTHVGLYQYVNFELKPVR